MKGLDNKKNENHYGRNDFVRGSQCRHFTSPFTLLGLILEFCTLVRSESWVCADFFLQRKHLECSVKEHPLARWQKSRDCATTTKWPNAASLLIWRKKAVLSGSKPLHASRLGSGKSPGSIRELALTACQAAVTGRHLTI